MSWYYLREGGAESLPTNPLNSKPCVLSSGNPTPKQSFWPAKLTKSWNLFRYGTTLEPSMEPRGVEKSTLLPPAFLANLSASLAPNKVKKMKGICGPTPSESLGKWDRNGAYWKTSQACLFTTISDRFSGTWPRRGTMRNGEFFQPKNVERPTAERDFGLWLTPRAAETAEDPEKFVKRNGDRNYTKCGSLSAQVKYPAMWPTPTKSPDAPNKNSNRTAGPNSLTECARLGSLVWPLNSVAKEFFKDEIKKSEKIIFPTPKATENRAGFSSNGGTPSLDHMALHNKWPSPTVRDSRPMGKSDKDRNQPRLATVVKGFATPQSRDYRTGQADRWDNPEKSRNLNDQVAKLSWPTPKTNGMAGGSGAMEIMERRVEAGDMTNRDKLDMTAGNGGQLNPDWVEWLMGWPVGWTSLEPLTYIPDFSWEAEPENLPRIAQGVPHRVDRLKAIGNGQVPNTAALAWRTLSALFEEKE